MEDCEADRKTLRAACSALGVDPDGDHAPDIDAIANRDESLTAKIEAVRDGVTERTDGDRPGR